MEQNHDVACDVLEMTRANEIAEDATLAVIEEQNKELDFDNTDDFRDVNRGFIDTFAEIGSYDISGPYKSGNVEKRGVIAKMIDRQLFAYDEESQTLGEKVIFDLTLYDFLDDDTNNAGTTVNPSLWRQSKLNKKHGLFEVLEDKIYQVRGYDLANITFILTTNSSGAEEWAVVDPLTCKETAAAAYALLNQLGPQHLRNLEIRTILSTHSHADHFGGIGGLIHESELSTDGGKTGVEFIAPDGFFEHAVSENLMAGNAMNQRASLMYGNACTKGVYGTVGSGLGQTTSEGSTTIMEPTRSIFETGEKVDVNDVEIEFMITPGAEAPDEFMFFVTTYNAFCPAEEINHTQHNLLTPRGAKVRDGLIWSKYIDAAIQLWGDKVDVIFGSHHWPMWKYAEDQPGVLESDVLDYMKKQRDLYRFIHDQSLRMANNGLTIQEIGEKITLPTTLNSFFANRGYYGTLIHNAKAQYQMYFGWFDGNPASLYQLPPEAAGALYVRYMQNRTEDSILDLAQADFDKGLYREVVMILNNVVFSGKEYIGNLDLVKDLLAKAYTQLGYQSESGPWRNFFLAGAAILKDEGQSGATLAMSDEFRLGITIDLYFDYMAMRVKGIEAATNPFVINWEFTDKVDANGDNRTAVSYLENGALTTRLDVDSEESYGSIDIVSVKLDKNAFSQLCLVPSGQLPTNLMDIDGIDSISDEVAFREFLGLLDTLATAEEFNIVTP